LCMLSVSRTQASLPLPMSTPVFTGLSALAFVGAGALLRSGSRAGTVCGWALVLLPLVVFGTSYANASHTIYPFGRDATVFLVALGLSALGVVAIAFTRKPDRGLEEVEGIDTVEELFTQVERAERSEARVVELERQLRAYIGQQTGQQSAPVRRVR
jgi:hypothetical protein